MVKSQKTGSKTSALRFLENPAWRQNYRVSDDEVASVSSVALLGEMKGERDLLFIINQLRRAKLRW
jgi:hypothetical protein